MTSSALRIVRIAVALALVIVLGVFAVRNAAVNALAEVNPAAAARVWPSHPVVMATQASREIAAAAGAGRPIGDPTFAMMNDVARRSPLDPQPYIVSGIRADVEGRAMDARDAFRAARHRDPRFLPARYFLATTRLRNGDVGGLEDVAALARLSPNGSATLAPFVAAFVRQARARAPIQAVFAKNPQMRDAVLSVLATDPDNLTDVLFFGGSADPQAPWLKQMITTLATAGRFGQARALWAKSSGVSAPDPGAIFDANFQNPGPPAPFNWELTSSTVGLAERESGRLHVIYYGQSDGVLARQLLTLPPGRYRLRAPMSGAAAMNDDGPSLLWTLHCASGASKEPFASFAAQQQSGSFEVKPGCAAQWLELSGRSSDFGTESDTRIGPILLSRGGQQ